MSADMMRRELLWRREWGVRSPSPCWSVHNYAVEALLHLLAVTQTRTLSRSHGAERDPAKIVCQVRIASLQIPPYLAIGFLCKIFCTKFDHAYHWMLMEWLFNRSDVEFKKKTRIAHCGSDYPISRIPEAVGYFLTACSGLSWARITLLTR